MYNAPRRKIPYVSLLLLSLIIFSINPVYSTDLCRYLSKDTRVMYETTYRSSEGVYREYYMVQVLDSFQSSQGLMFKLKINYLGMKTIQVEKYVLCYNIPDYIPSLLESIEEFKSKGFGDVSEPIPLLYLLHPTSNKDPSTYTTIRVSLVSISDYVLNISRERITVKALSVKGSFKGYSIHGFIEEKTGLVLRMSFVDLRTNRLTYEIRLTYFSAVESLKEEETVESGGSIFPSLIPLVFIAVVLIVSIASLLYVVHKVSRMLRY